ncbi:MAG: hypothetical protein GY940_05150 [bacterium]|nr:hypothetical protein [bacterium]
MFHPNEENEVYDDWYDLDLESNESPGEWTFIGHGDSLDDVIQAAVEHAKHNKNPIHLYSIGWCCADGLTINDEQRVEEWAFDDDPKKWKRIFIANGLGW